jgi:hypothetical protein
MQDNLEYDKYTNNMYDNRPVISSPLEKKINEIILLKEKELTDLVSKQEVSEPKGKTILDETVNEVILKVNTHTSNFIDDYYLHVDKNRDKGFLLYVYSFMDYINEDDKCLYVGIFTLFVGVLMYFLNPYNNNGSNS